MAETLLIVEDEPKLAALLADYLQASGFQTHWLDQGLGVADWVRLRQPDLLLLDLMLPGKDGLDVCKEIRAFSAVPIIMVTARVEEIDRLLGLELGADDYICKPFSPREVVARVKAVLRRSRAADPRPESALQLNRQALIASCGGRDLELTAVEFRLLTLLSGEPYRVFSREQIMQRIYADYRVVSDRTIDSHVKKLRAKLRSCGEGFDPIRSVYGVGYRYEPEVR